MCLIILFALIGPRVALAYTWIFTTLIERAYDGWLLPVLGFVFLPWTTLMYAVAYDGTDVSPLGWLFVAIALMADIASYSRSPQAYRAYGA
jgi:hypothetical protein